MQLPTLFRDDFRPVSHLTALDCVEGGGHSFFVHGFVKNEKANITPKELKALKNLAATFLGLDAEALEKASAAAEIAEVRNDDEDGRQD